MKRCDWVTNDPLYVDYHDNEWGIPVFDDKKFFEMLTLEGAQAGLSWITILRKRENYRKAFDDFNYYKIAEYTEEQIRLLKLNNGIIRNDRKIRSAVQNANAFIKIQQRFGSFTEFIWSFVNHRPIINCWMKVEDIPSQTELSNRISKELKKNGFSFVGPVIIYSFLQATGIINDHLMSCNCHPFSKSDIPHY